jgi:hypothetical protein
MNIKINGLLFELNDDGSDPMLEGVIENLLAQGLSEEEISVKIDQIINERLPEAAIVLLGGLKKESKRMLADRRKIRRGFQKRQVKKWREPFDLLLMLLEAFGEAGEEYNRTFRAAAATENDFVFDALIKLHARSWLIGGEILWLMQGGYASAAMARWRTLHEIAVVSLFIRDKGQDVAERYLLHHIVESCRAAHQYQEHCVRLGYDPFSQEELDEMDAERDQLCTRFGRAYRNDWGWAADSLGMERVNFTDIEKAVSLEHLRPYFKLASYSNHAGGKGIVYDLGKELIPDGHELMLSGPSDAGMDEPGQCTAISIDQINANLFAHRRATATSLIFVHALHLLTNETVSAFVDAGKRLRERAEQIHSLNKISSKNSVFSFIERFIYFNK